MAGLMGAVSVTVEARARKNEKIVLQRLASVGQKPIADAIGVHESTVSRLKEGAISQFAQALAAMNLKIVPTEMKCYRPEDIEPYIQLAKQHMRTVTSVHDLVDDDPE
jgi:hypothetical protein